MTEVRDTSTGQAAASASRGGRAWALVPLAVVVALTILFLLSLSAGDPSRLPSALIGRPVPEFELRPLEGLLDGGRPVAGFGHAELARGEVAVVNFWASWCIPCVQEHPVLVELQRRTKAKIYGVNYKDQTEAARRFLGRYGNPFHAVGVDGNGRVAIDWGVYDMPETFVVDGRGRIVYKHVGPLSPEALEAKVVPAIETARRAGSGR